VRVLDLLLPSNKNRIANRVRLRTKPFILRSIERRWSDGTTKKISFVYRVPGKDLVVIAGFFE